jgi:hypothetical protein
MSHLRFALLSILACLLPCGLVAQPITSASSRASTRDTVASSKTASTIPRAKGLYTCQTCATKPGTTRKHSGHSSKQSTLISTSFRSQHGNSNGPLRAE